MKKYLTSKRLILLVMLVVLTSLSIWLIFFQAGNYLVRNSGKIPRQGVFLILMGSIPDRALAAIDLYKDYPQTRQIWIVEENMLGLEFFREKGYKVFSNSEQMAAILAQAGVPDSIIHIIPGMARSTLMEASAVAKYIKDNNRVDSLVIISSAAHTRRAYMIFDDILNKSYKLNVAISTYPSIYSGYDCKRYYSNKEDIQTTLSEYLKIISFYLFER